MIETLLSGAQTGADRAALDWAIFRDVPHGGWCPKGRKAEDGKIPPHYQLTETPSASYLQRTEWNVRDSDGTVIFTVAAELAGGSKRTADFAKGMNRGDRLQTDRGHGLHIDWGLCPGKMSYQWNRNNDLLIWRKAVGLR